ncbi:DUF726-domain-containing protein [Fomitiporia mediterranea MF3/22]|uniref:DUF726-domain-containing protein n=1 Tax=Fomitiporia mediterranea (strain MF3/22) TaxID=694068 RepID=UPI00044080B7|nr:DUF726-domain-containing protein [Fomitiporia mediterranea MF3/22]EJD03554.1 DUF726-domain-containing protein [Fomitiporia mediterranea MF3/22]
MPVIRDDFANGLDEEDRKKFHYVTPEKDGRTVNATGNLIDFDDRGQEWREKTVTKEDEFNDYTRLRLNEEDDNDEIHLRTKFLFDEDKAMTPLSQMQATKDMLTEAQRIAYVGLCSLVAKGMSNTLRLVKNKDLKPALDSMELWRLKIMGRLYYHMGLETQEQKMIESLAEHGVLPEDLVPSLMTTHTVANPEYDPVEGKKKEIAQKEAQEDRMREEERRAEDITEDVSTSEASETVPKTPQIPTVPYQTTANVLPPSAPDAVPGVSTSLSAADKDVTLDIRWTILCDLFLVLIADSVYDARSRGLIESVAVKLGVGWLDVVRFEQRVTEALEIQEAVEKLEQKDIIEGRVRAAKKRRYAMLGLATLGGGLVIGLSAGVLAPFIGAGLAGAFTTIGVTGTGAFLAGTGGAAVITTAGTLTGSGIAVRGMARRTQDVRIFDLLPLHNNKRVNCILTVSGFMTSSKDDVRLPFSVLDPVVGDVFSVLWEPEMLGETGSALKILTSEVLSQVGQSVLQATVMAGLMSALQWPILLTKLGYLIDNPWNNALDRAKAAGLVLADVLIRRHLGVRPITLIGFSIGSRVIFYCLLELAKHKAYGIVQDVFILGSTLTASKQNWLQARSVVSGRFVNGYARNDWVLNYLFRATSGGLQNIAGLRPVNDVPGLENVDVTDKIAGHMSYRTFMPLILDQLGFPVSADYFNEPEEPDFTGDRIVVREDEEQPKKKTSWFSRRKSKPDPKVARRVSRPPSALNLPKNPTSPKAEDDELPERIEHPKTPTTPTSAVKSSPNTPIQSPPATPRASDVSEASDGPPVHAGFDFRAIHEVIANEGTDPNVLHAPIAQTPRAQVDLSLPHEPSGRPESVPPPVPAKNQPLEEDRSATLPRPGRNSDIRISSTPLFGSGAGFGENEDDEDDGDISSALGSSLGFAGPSASRRDLASSFVRSVSLTESTDHGKNYSDTTPGPSGDRSVPQTSRSDYWGSPVSSGTRDAWSGGIGVGFSDRFTSSENGKVVDESPKLSFGGPGGNFWEPSSTTLNESTPVDTALRSPFASPPATASLPADILNPFAISTTDLSSGTERSKTDDHWSSPPLPSKSSTKLTSSTLNINSNPWS